MPIDRSTMTWSLALAISSLLTVWTGPAGARTMESTYLPPFERAEAEHSANCADAGCLGVASASADQGGSLTADAEVTAAGIGRGEAGIASVGFSHELAEPASEVTVELGFHVDEAFASALGAPGSRGESSIGVEAYHASSSWAFAYTWQPIVTAEAPMTEDEMSDRELIVTATMSADGRLIPAGEIDVTAYLLSEATTMPPHAPSGPAASCANDCVGAGRAEAHASGTVESVTVEEVR